MNELLKTNCDNKIIDNTELKQILIPRIPPHIWDIIGYGGGLTTVFYYNENDIIIIYSCFFVFYGLLNILFDILTVSFEYGSDKFPNYKNMGYCRWYVTNKKYNTDNKFTRETNANSNENLKKYSVSFEISVYVGEHNLIKNMLFYIYLMGITKKNFTLDDEKFKEAIKFVG